MASLRYQKRWIDNGTVDGGYRLDGEILDQAHHAMVNTWYHSDDPNKNQLREVQQYFDEEFDRAPEDYYKSEQWLNMAAAVRKYLLDIEKFDLEAWEDENV